MKAKVILALTLSVMFGGVQIDIGSIHLFTGQTAYSAESEARAQRQVTGELTRIEGNTLTITVRRDAGSRDETLKVNPNTKIHAETDETETIAGEGGASMTHRKTADRELGDLKLGQRVLVRYLDGIASRVLILYPRPVREGGESRKDELKAERQREADRPREGERPREDDAGHDGDLRTVNGELKHIEPGVLIILVRKDGGVELEHKVPTAVKMEVFVNNGPATAEQLKIGQRVRVRLNAAGSATRIDIRKKEGKQEGGEKPRSFGFLNQSEVSLPPAIN